MDARRSPGSPLDSGPAGRARDGRNRRFGHAEVFALVFALVFVVARFLPVLEIGYPCPFKDLTGLPCATCGMTHAFVHLAHGDVGLAIAANPLGALLAFAAWSFAVLDLVRVVAALPLPSLGARGARVAARVGIAAVAVNWVLVFLAHDP